MDEIIKKQLAFSLEIDKAKNILRQTHLSSHGRRENKWEFDRENFMSNKNIAFEEVGNFSLNDKKPQTELSVIFLSTRQKKQYFIRNAINL